MSTITVTNIKATGETASRPVSGVAAVWVNFDGNAGTIATRDSVNVSGLTDVGTGLYTIAFTNNMGNGNYSFTGEAKEDESGGHSGTPDRFCKAARVAFATSEAKVYCVNGSNVARDPDGVYCQIMGDLA